MSIILQPQQLNRQRLKAQQKHKQQRVAHHRKETHHVHKLNQIKVFMCAQVHLNKIQKTVTCSINVQQMMKAMICPSQNSLAHQTLHTMRNNVNVLNQTVALATVQDH